MHKVLALTLVAGHVYRVTGPRATSEARAIAAIERHGALLVYPIANREQPRSLWSVLYPGVDMRWAWDEGADPRVVSLWHLRERIARSRAVPYGKWYRGRAVFFSRELFAALLALVRSQPIHLSPEAREILSLVEEDSPQSSKALRQAAGLRGRLGERVWTKEMKTLWEHLLIVGTGELDDGAFPSLLVGATRWIFEDMWEAAALGLSSEQRAVIERHMPASSPFGKYLRQTIGVVG